jgi:hypothetical protein
MASDWFVSAGDGIELAQTQMKQNRDEQQDARQDCQNAEGVVGEDDHAPGKHPMSHSACVTTRD